MEEGPTVRPTAAATPCEERVAPRFTLLIRAAKLIDPHGEFICVIRDVSATGVSLRGFHALPDREAQELELQTGERYAIDRVWHRGAEAGYSFRDAVEVADLIAESGPFPKRQLRLELSASVRISTGGLAMEADLTNLSQQGARIECDWLFALDQPLRLSSPLVPELVARVRWREGRTYGVVFDDTFNLRELAILAARLQNPALLADPLCASAQRRE